ncbi:hypothetical protein [Rubellimicrobium roseum]|uniref:hypothetical protein n=1 Tax=Rubellimicrobium roseum TaxID=687525 RepID=UPI00159BE6A3|nr:hypothetical protein [Rubellimicrobium roseum]
MKLLGLALGSLPVIVAAETSADYAAMSRTLWEAFECGYFAEKFGDTEEASRLYFLGISAGRQFLLAYDAGQSTRRSRCPAGTCLSRLNS